MAFQKPARREPSVACVHADMMHAATAIGWSGKWIFASTAASALLCMPTCAH